MVPVIDASVFLGMNHEDSATRQKCLQIILDNFESGLEINLEQIGLCDKIIWQRSREEQDFYYPFMDYLHTVMRFIRVPYISEAYQLATIDHRLNHLPITKAIITAHVLTGERKLYTIDHELLSLPVLSSYIMPIASTPTSKDSFDEPLRSLYQKSLNLKLTSQEVESV